MKERVLYMDIARSVAVLWIVGYWHLVDYVGESHAEDSVHFHGAGYITDIALGLFMFLSGFFLAKYMFMDFYKDSIAFYKKRLTRFYVLYALSALTLFLIGFNPGASRLLFTLLAVSTYIPPQPDTLWFFSMLTSFYLMTPLVIQRGNTVYAVSRAVAILTLCGLLRVLGVGIDIRFFWCFPLYFFGLYIGKRPDYASFLLRGPVAAVVLVVFLILLAFFENSAYGFPFTYVLVPLGIQLTLYLSYKLSSLVNRRVVEMIAYGSMCAYLFHRQIYGLLKYGCDLMGLDLPLWLVILVYLPICLVISYGIQSLYDFIVTRKS